MRWGQTNLMQRWILNANQVTMTRVINPSVHHLSVRYVVKLSQLNPFSQSTLICMVRVFFCNDHFTGFLKNSHYRFR